MALNYLTWQTLANTRARGAAYDILKFSWAVVLFSQRREIRLVLKCNHYTFESKSYKNINFMVMINDFSAS